MGYSNTSTAFLGMKIDASLLLSALSPDNWLMVLEMFRRGYLEDENDEYNCSLENAMDEEDYNSSIEAAKLTISKVLSKSPTPMNLLVPHVSILEHDRGGHDRCGSNAISASFDMETQKSEIDRNMRNWLVYLLTRSSSSWFSVVGEQQGSGYASCHSRMPGGCTCCLLLSAVCCVNDL
jgi:hypothetical protein